jgi:hypothetical protein
MTSLNVQEFFFSGLATGKGFAISGWSDSEGQSQDLYFEPVCMGLPGLLLQRRKVSDAQKLSQSALGLSIS